MTRRELLLLAMAAPMAAALPESKAEATSGLRLDNVSAPGDRVYTYTMRWVNGRVENLEE